MAITNEEKRLALALYDRYSDVFDSIYDALVATGTIDYNIADMAPGNGRTTGRLAVRLDNQVIANDTVRLLFDGVLRYIVDHGEATRIPLPWGPSKTRYLLTNQTPPIHPNGREFFYPVTHQGYTMESHYDRDRALKLLGDLCDRMEISFEVIEVRPCSPAHRLRHSHGTPLSIASAAALGSMACALSAFEVRNIPHRN